MEQEYQKLESELESRFVTQRGNMVVCSSGTAALHLALESFQIPNLCNREVIIPDYCMYACARAVTLAGMIPVPVDCKAKDLLIDPELIETAITKRTCAIMSVHNYGRKCEMETINDIAREYDLVSIEDMAEVHGTTVHERTDAACWSFYQNKIIAGEEGGAVHFLMKENADYARKLRNLGFNEPHDYSHCPRGHNYRMSNLHARAIRQSNWAYPGNLVLRRQVEKWYDWNCPDEWRMPERQAPWVYDLRIPGLTPDRQTELICELRASGVAARHGFKPISTQEEYRYRVKSCPQALLASQEVIYLPIAPNTTQEECERAFEILVKKMWRK